jgi:hypothetical protein
VEVTADVVELVPRCVRAPVPVLRTRPHTFLPSSRANAVACAVAGRALCGCAIAVAATASKAAIATRRAFTRYIVVS